MTVNLALNQGLGNAAAGDTWSGIEIIRGSAFADTLIGDANANRLEGGAGNDSITGNLGADVLIGGGGDDIFYFRSLTDVALGEQIDGGTGTDTLDFTLAAGTEYDIAVMSPAIVTGVERIVTGVASVGLALAQLDAVNYVRGNFVLTTGGTISMSGVDIGISATVFRLSASGQCLRPDRRGRPFGQCLRQQWQ